MAAPTMKIKNMQRKSACGLKGNAFSGFQALAHLHQVKDQYDVPDGNRMLDLVAKTLDDRRLCTPRYHRVFRANYDSYKKDHSMCLPDDCKLSEVICK